ncbi:unnamed protein product [Caenorhabditis sp. 36 PRJEB53466]|nr:unnamed protein product [Caenorhabditis sp. 36 PRJEB53466]
MTWKSRFGMLDTRFFNSAAVTKFHSIRRASFRSWTLAYISTQNWLAAKGIKDLQWPACSPDLNPVENVWGLLVRRVYRHGKQYASVQDLKDALLIEWNLVTAAELKNLVSSMPKRLFQVIQKNGGETSY